MAVAAIAAAFPHHCLGDFVRRGFFGWSVLGGLGNASSDVESEEVDVTLAWRFFGSMTAVMGLVAVLGIIAELVPVH